MIDYGFGVTLGPLDPEHRDKALTWRNDRRIYEWCRQFEPIAQHDHSAWFTRQAADSSLRMYAVQSPTGLFVGVCGLTSLDWVNRRAEFSLYIGPEHQKKGFAKAALSTLLSHGFRALNLHLIWGESFEGNPACAMFERLGFFHEGYRRQFYYRDGKYIDAHLYSMTAPDWEHLCNGSKSESASLTSPELPFSLGGAMWPMDVLYPLPPTPKTPPPPSVL